MTEADKVVREALGHARARRPDQAMMLLDQMKSFDPKPLLYWYSLSQARLARNEHELAYNCLSAFRAKLYSNTWSWSSSPAAAR